VSNFLGAVQKGGFSVLGSIPWLYLAVVDGLVLLDGLTI
jgi:hypothetical protein